MTTEQQQSKRKHQKSKRLRMILHRNKQRRGSGLSRNVGAADPHAPPQNQESSVAAVDPAAVSSSMKPALDDDADVTTASDSLVVRADSRAAGNCDECSWMVEESPVGAAKPSSTITETNHFQSQNPHHEDDTATPNTNDDDESNQADSESKGHKNCNMQKADTEGSRSDENATNGKRKSSNNSGKTKQLEAMKMKGKNSTTTQTAAASYLTTRVTEWTCPKCTLCNPIHKRRCQVCQERRPTDMSLGGLLLSSQETISACDAEPAVDMLIKPQPSAVLAKQCSKDSSRKDPTKPKRKVDGVADQKIGMSTLPLVVTLEKKKTQNQSATKETEQENAAASLSSTAHSPGAPTRSQKLDGRGQLQIDNSHSQHQPQDAKLYSTTTLQEQQQHLMLQQLQNEQNELLEQQELLRQSEFRLRQEQQRLWQEQQRVRQEQQDNQRSMEINRNLLRRNQQFFAFLQMSGQQLSHFYSPASPRQLPETLKAPTCHPVSATEPPKLLQQTPASHRTATTAASSPMTSVSRSTGNAFRSDSSPELGDVEIGIEVVDEVDEEASKYDTALHSSSDNALSFTEEGHYLHFGGPSRALSPFSSSVPHARNDVPSPSNSTQTADGGKGDESSRPNSNKHKTVVNFDKMKAVQVCDALEASQTSTQTIDFSLSHPRPMEKRPERTITAGILPIESGSHAMQNDAKYPHTLPSAKGTASIAPDQRDITAFRAECSASSPEQNNNSLIDSQKLHVASPTNLTDAGDYFELDKPEENVLSKKSGSKIDHTDSRPSSIYESSASATQEMFSVSGRSKGPVLLKATSNKSTKPQSSSGGAWQSNKLARDFVNQLEQRAASSLTAAPSSSTAVASTWKPALCKSVSVSTYSSIPPRLSRLRDDLWDESQESSQLDDEPGYAYKETVRCKSARQGLQCFDCPDCRRFYEVLRKTGHEVPEDFEKTAEMLGRHRALYIPSETPVDFWELDFVDELGAPEVKKRKADGSDKEDETPQEKKPKSYNRA